MLRVNVKGVANVKRLADGLRRIPGFKDELAKEFAEDAAGKTKKSIASGRDPYGGKWPKGDTAGLRRLASSVQAHGRFLVLAHRYINVHQSGGTMSGNMRFRSRGRWRRARQVTVPARPLMPTKGMPPRWQSSFQTKARKTIKARMRL